MTSYDYIIAGAGAAGLSLAVHMIRSGKFSDKRILIIDREDKNKNDRTWCFWETEPGLFESVVSKKWSLAWFHGSGFSKLLDFSPYEYKLIRGIDFYNYCLDLIGQQPNIEIRKIDIIEINEVKGITYVSGGNEKISAGCIFSSILFDKPVLKKGSHYLLQHFKGWVIESTRVCFKPGEATLMDFRVDQTHGTSFIYVMPFSEKKALVEYTLFTGQLIPSDAYEEALRKYIRDFLAIEDYQVVQEEYGVIPMTDHKFPVRTGNIIYIGTAGGQTKASSGYTFRFIQKHCAAIINGLPVTGKTFAKGTAGSQRHKFYDRVLLDILQHNKLPGHSIFSAMFRKNKAPQVLKFLDNETTIPEELKILSTLPTWPFLKAAMKQV